MYIENLEVTIKYWRERVTVKYTKKTGQNARQTGRERHTKTSNQTINLNTTMKILQYKGGFYVKKTYSAAKRSIRTHATRTIADSDI